MCLGSAIPVRVELSHQDILYNILLFCVLQKVPDSVMSLTFTEIRQISCGAHFMMAMDEDGEIHSWGANKYGQVRLLF